MSVKGIELVNAEGESIHAGPDQNAECYWAARGAGPGFFGVVTRYQLQLQPLPPVMRMSTATYRLEDADLVTEWLPEVVRTLPPQVELNCFVASAPPEAQKASDNRPQKLFIVSAVAFADTQADALRWLKPIADAPVATDRRLDLNQEASFASLDKLTDQLYRENRRYAADSFTSNASPKEILSRLHDSILAAPSAESFTLLSLPSPPPPNAPALPDMAFSMSGSAFVAIHSLWQDPAQNAANEQWVRQTSKLLDPNQGKLLRRRNGPDDGTRPRPALVRVRQLAALAAAQEKVRPAGRLLQLPGTELSGLRFAIDYL